MQGALGTLFPAAASKTLPRAEDIFSDQKSDLADIGGRLEGPFLTGVLLAVFSPEDIHLMTMGCF